MEAGAKYLASRTTEPDRCAVIFNGQIGEGNTFMSAVIAHVGERGGSHGYTLFQPYDSETFSALGQPQYLGYADQLLGRQT